MLTTVDGALELVVTVKLALVTPAGTVTLGGGVATAGWLVPSVTTAPPKGAAALKVTVPVEELPAVTLLGFSVSDDTVTQLTPGGVTTSVAVLAQIPPKNKEMFAEVQFATEFVVTVKLALVAFGGTVTMPGTLAAGLLLEGKTSVPLQCAGPLSVTVAVEEPPPTTVLGLKANEEMLSVGGAVVVIPAFLMTPP